MLLTGDVDQGDAPAHAPAPAHQTQRHRHHLRHAHRHVHKHAAHPAQCTRVPSVSVLRPRATSVSIVRPRATSVSVLRPRHLSNVSACACQRGQPRVAGEEQLQQASTRRPDTRVPGHVVCLRRHVARVAAPRPGHRQLSTRQTAADLWLRTGMAPLIRLSVSCSTVRRSRGGTRSLLSFYSPAWDLLD